MEPAGEATILEADLRQPDHATGLVDLLDDYARDLMGGGQPLGQATRDAIIPGLLRHPTSRVFLARLDRQFVGAAVCFTGFSTFQARPLLNIHDLTVKKAYRGRGIGRLLLRAIVDHATAGNCCKITLEVRADNPARRLYEREGFGCSQNGSQQVQYLFLDKPLG